MPVTTKSKTISKPGKRLGSTQRVSRANINRIVEDNLDVQLVPENHSVSALPALQNSTIPVPVMQPNIPYFSPNVAFQSPPIYNPYVHQQFAQQQQFTQQQYVQPRQPFREVQNIERPSTSNNQVSSRRPEVED